MKLGTMLTLIVSLFLLGACQGLTRSAPILNQIDPNLTASCTYPVRIPVKDLTQYEVEKYWITDRKNLVVCAKSKEALVKAIETRDRLLKGQ